MLQPVRTAALLLSAAALLLLPVGCSSDSDDSVDVVGTWERSFTAGGPPTLLHLTFSADGTFMLSVAGTEGGITGTYALNGRRLSVEDVNCEEASTYSVEIIRGRLAFTTIEDPCGRSTFLTGSWQSVTAT